MPILYATVIALKESLELFFFSRELYHFDYICHYKEEFRIPGVYEFTFGWEESEVQNTGCLSIGIAFVHNVGGGLQSAGLMGNSSTKWCILLIFFSTVSI